MSLEKEKEEPEVSDAQAHLSDLYKGHVVKKELVLGPVVLQPSDLVYNLNGQNKLLANVNHEPATYTDKLGVTTTVYVKRESKWEAEERLPASLGPEERDMPESHGESEERNMAESHVDSRKCAAMTHDYAVKQELLKLEADDSKINGKYQNPQDPSSHATTPDSTQNGSLITEKLLLKKYAKLQPERRRSSRKRISKKGGEELKKTIIKSKTPKVYECNYCGKRFSLRPGLINHIRIHTGEKPYLCQICFKKFSDCAVLIRHIRMHAGRKPYACDICGKKYSEKYLLKNHKFVHTGQMKYFCTLCPKTFVNSSNFRRHQRVHMHKYICDICKKHFEKKDGLVSHIMYHMRPKPYTCKYCDKGFSQSGHLNRHLAIHIGSNKVHACGVCNKVFSQKASLKKHVSRKVCEKN